MLTHPVNAGQHFDLSQKAAPEQSPIGVRNHAIAQPEPGSRQRGLPAHAWVVVVHQRRQGSCPSLRDPQPAQTHRRAFLHPWREIAGCPDEHHGVHGVTESAEPSCRCRPPPGVPRLQLPQEEGTLMFSGHAHPGKCDRRDEDKLC